MAIWFTCWNMDYPLTTLPHIKSHKPVDVCGPVYTAIEAEVIPLWFVKRCCPIASWHVTGFEVLDLWYRLPGYLACITLFHTTQTTGTFMVGRTGRTISSPLPHRGSLGEGNPGCLGPYTIWGSICVVDGVQNTVAVLQHRNCVINTRQFDGGLYYLE